MIIYFFSYFYEFYFNIYNIIYMLNHYNLQDIIIRNIILVFYFNLILIFLII